MFILSEDDPRYWPPKEPWQLVPYRGELDANAHWSNPDGSVTWVYPVALNAFAFGNPYAGQRLLLTAAEWAAEEARQLANDESEFAGFAGVAAILAPAIIGPALGLFGETTGAAAGALEAGSAAETIAAANTGFEWAASYEAANAAAIADAYTWAGAADAGSALTADALQLPTPTATQKPITGEITVEYESLEDIMNATGNEVNYDWELDYGETIADGLDAAGSLPTVQAGATSTGGLKGIADSLTAAIKTASGVVAAIGGIKTAATTPPPPNTTRTVGRTNLGLLALLGIGFVMLQG